MSRCVVGMVTCGSKVEARKLAQAVLEPKLAACVNIISGIESHYWWQGKLEQGTEWLLVIKTTESKSAAVGRAIKAAHSYDVPEIVFVKIARGDRRYLKWLRGAVTALAFVCVSVRGDMIDDTLKQLRSGNAEARAEAADRLAQTGGERVVKQFRAMIASPNAEARQMGVTGLLRVSRANEDVEMVRVRLAEDKESLVRWSAALALGQSGRVEAVPSLVKAAKSDASELVREMATESLELLAPARRAAELRERARRDPSDATANWNVAESYLEEGREDLAEPHLRNVIGHDEANRNGHTPDALLALGVVLGHRGRHAQAAYCCEELLKRWPEFARKDKALYCLGLSRLALGQKEKGRIALEQLVREFPDSSVVKLAKESLDKLGGK
jgi:periplasmic divalent cation tolerance protein